VLEQSELSPEARVRKSDRASVEALARKFKAGGCCGKTPTVTMPDLQAAGLTPIPTVFVSSIGQILPRSGWKALCLYVYESLERKPFPLKDQKGDPGTVVAEALLRAIQ